MVFIHKSEDSEPTPLTPGSNEFDESGEFVGAEKAVKNVKTAQQQAADDAVMVLFFCFSMSNYFIDIIIA